MTTRTKTTFAVKAYADGIPFIVMEPLREQLKGEGLPSGFFGFDLKPGTTGEQAEAIAQHLNDSIDGLTFTAMPLV